MAVTTPHPPILTDTHRDRLALTSAWVLAAGIVLSSLYGLLAEDPYRGMAQSTITSAHAQDVCSVVVAVLMLMLLASVVLVVRWLTVLSPEQDHFVRPTLWES